MAQRAQTDCFYLVTRPPDKAGIYDYEPRFPDMRLDIRKVHSLPTAIVMWWENEGKKPERDRASPHFYKMQDMQ